MKEIKARLKADGRKVPEYMDYVTDQDRWFKKYRWVEKLIRQEIPGINTIELISVLRKVLK